MPRHLFLFVMVVNLGVTLVNLGVLEFSVLLLCYSRFIFEGWNGMK